MTTRTLDLDARRAARREAAGEPVQFVFGGETFLLPVEMPLDALDKVAGVDAEGLTDEQAIVLIVPLMQAMLGDEDWRRFMLHRPSIEDMVDLAEFMWAEYGITPQTPSQSPEPARASGARSKRTSRPTTGSTRAKSPAAR